ncbi:hypothetical protein [Pilimelia anulata]|uniref:hypothetical protein n=1 Tax=Pilimelia anulata TaxID=53371 RepID=UPI001668D927|nr:hypothetical protein [Pilimelia anulata]
MTRSDSDDYPVVLVGVGREGGGVTMTASVGTAALRRIGGRAGRPIPDAGRGHWDTREASAHAVRLSGDERAVSIDPDVHRGGPHRGQVPRAGRVAGSPSGVRATVVADDLTGDGLAPCAGSRRTEVLLHLPSEPPHALVLNGLTWVRNGGIHERHQHRSPRR